MRLMETSWFDYGWLNDIGARQGREQRLLCLVIWVREHSIGQCVRAIGERHWLQGVPRSGLAAHGIGLGLGEDEVAQNTSPTGAKNLRKMNVIAA